METPYRHVGGIAGHIFRRMVHLSLTLIPIIYYWFSDALPMFSRDQWVSLLVIIALVLEFIRYKRGLVIFGQRHYESQQISATAWGTLGIGLVLLVAPKVGLQGAALGAPLIWSSSIGDPVMGEARRLNCSNTLIILLGMLVVTLVWLLAVAWLATPWQLVPLLVPLTIFAEYKKYSWIDDNATMVLLPLALIVLCVPWLTFL